VLPLLLVNYTDERADRHLFHEGNFAQVIPELRLKAEACWPAVKFNLPMDKVCWGWRHVILVSAADAVSLSIRLPRPDKNPTLDTL
jgi:hypothetical protein